MEQKEDKSTVQDFVREYNELVQRLGFKIVAVPQYMARDDGTFSLVLQYTVVATPKEN